MVDFVLFDPKRERTIRFPMDPEKVSVKMGTRIINFTITATGGFEFPQGRNARHYSWSGILPGENRTATTTPWPGATLKPGEIFPSPGTVVATPGVPGSMLPPKVHVLVPWIKNFDSPKKIVKEASRWVEENTLLELTVAEFNIDVDVFVQAFDHDYGGGYGDVNYQIELVEHRPLLVHTVDSDTSGGDDPSGKPPMDPNAEPGTAAFGPPLDNMHPVGKWFVEGTDGDIRYYYADGRVTYWTADSEWGLKENARSPGGNPPGSVEPGTGTEWRNS